jgi:hypothetical protein
MRRSHVALLLVLGAPVALYAGVLVPRAIPDRTDEPTTPAAYFPTTVGTKWVYQLTDRSRHGIMRWEEIEVITDARESAEERIVIVKQLKGDTTRRSREWAVSDTGVRWRVLPEQRWRDERREEPTPWEPSFPQGIAPGTSWTVERPDDRSRHVCTVTGWETVHVPAGAYKALRMNVEIIELDRSGNRAGALQGACWFAPGVGCVKFDLAADFAPWSLTRELMSFSMPPGQ